MKSHDVTAFMDYKTGEAVIQFRVPKEEARDALEVADSLRDKIADVTMKTFRKRRSLDANAYCWVLIGKIAAATNQRNTDVYRTMIREIGDNFEIIPIRNDALEFWKKVCWSGRGLGWISEDFGPSKFPGYTNTINFYGSSVYDTKQMSALIEMAVFEAKQLGIETMTPAEIESLKNDWRATA